MSAFFVFVSLQMLVNVCHAERCSDFRFEKANKNSKLQARVKWVYDGDTLLLEDGKKIRIIGIDAPEVEHHRQKSEILGGEAREALRELLKQHHYKIYLDPGIDKKDRYKRSLAHVYLPDGTNVSSWLLERGLARTLPVPPNISLAKCYQHAENMAQQHSLGIWKLPANRLIESGHLDKLKNAYVRLGGSVEQIEKRKKYYQLVLKAGSNNLVYVRIKKQYLHYFNLTDLGKLIHRKIIVSGRLRLKKGRIWINVSYPTQLKLSK